MPVLSAFLQAEAAGVLEPRPGVRSLGSVPTVRTHLFRRKNGEVNV